MQKQSTKTHTPHNPMESPAGSHSFTIPLQDGSSEQVSVIVIHKDRPEFLNICLQSVHVMSNLNNYEVIVVDNGSGQETQEYLDVLQDEGIKVVRNDKNNLWSKACNQGVAVADPHSRYFVFLHADTVVLDPAWLDVMINISESRGAGLVGTQLQSYFIQKLKADFIQEWCMLMTRQCWDDIGPWPEELPLVGMSFIMTLRAQKKGHKPQATGNNIVHHYKAFCMDPSEYERIAEQAGGVVGKLMAKTQNA
jgi:GT2 family glycosyltransferase